jgi:iron complex outermembrane recepter protein
MIYILSGRMTFLAGVFSILFGAAAAAAAQPAATLSGSVVDQTGAPLPYVHVDIRGAVDRAAETGASGEFAFRDLPEGVYELSAELRHFERARRIVHVRVAEVAKVSITLRVAALEETLVTATKGAARDVQAMPMSISAMSSADLDRLGTRTLSDAAPLAPSVTLSQNANFVQLTIRGIGANVVNAGSDPSSAMYLDGVYLGRQAMGFVQFLDLDRVEVLRGPQGTLYGRNAVGGAVNMVSRPATNELEASATLSAANLGGLRANGRLSGALKRDRVMGSIAFARGVRDGYVRDLEHPDNPLAGDDSTAARGQLRLVFDRRTNLQLSADVDAQDGTPLTFNKVISPKPGFTFDNPPRLRDVRASALATNRTRQYGSSARLTTALAPSTSLVSLTAYRTLDYEFFVDADITELNVLTTHQHEKQRQISEELTVTHEQPRVTWIGGLFLFDEFDHQRYWVDQFIPRIQVRLDPRVGANSRAAFGQATLGLTSMLSATAGLRFTRESKDLENGGGRYAMDPPNLPAPGSAYGYSASLAHTAWTPKLGLELKLADDGLAYVSATRGFKSGGFNPSATATNSGYAPEYAWSYEAGWKGVPMNGRSRFALSVFVTDYTDLQVQTPIGIGVFDIRNAAAATIKGLEIENTTRLGRGVEAGGYVAWLDATYDRYIAVNNAGVTGDVSGNRLNNAPEWSGRLWIEWAADVGRGRRMSLAADATAQSTVFYTPFNDAIQRQSAYGLLGARGEYGPSSRRWAVALYARNLTDTDYVNATFGTAPTAFGGRPAPSRHVAIELTVRR